MAKLDTDNKYLDRRFGVEIEYNSFDKLDRSLGENDLPTGIYQFAKTIKENLKSNVDVAKWHYTNDNKNWVIKPDSSCGLEVCTPVLQGVNGLNSLGSAIEALAANKKITADERCSFHVHVEISDYSTQDIIGLFRTWICNEIFFYLLTTPKRWLNCYCQPLGFSFPIEVVENMNLQEIFDLLGNYKYYAINFFHYKKGKRKTVEYRVVGNHACLDPVDAQMWCKLFLIFTHQVKCDSYGFQRKPLKYFVATDTLRFLNLKYFSKDKELIYWLIERLNSLCNTKTLFDNNNNRRYIWEEIITSSRTNFLEAIEYLEGIL